MFTLDRFRYFVNEPGREKPQNRLEMLMLTKSGYRVFHFAKSAQQQNDENISEIRNLVNS